MIVSLVAFWRVINYLYQTIQNCPIAFYPWAISVSTFCEVLAAANLVMLYVTLDFWYVTLFSILCYPGFLIIC